MSSAGCPRWVDGCASNGRSGQLSCHHPSLEVRRDHLRHRQHQHRERGIPRIHVLALNELSRFLVLSVGQFRGQCQGLFRVRAEALRRGSQPGIAIQSVPAISGRQLSGHQHRDAASSDACAPRSKRQAFFGGWREVPVYALDDLRPGLTLAGPAIIEAETTTVLVDTGDHVTVNPLGWLDISLR